MDKHYRCGYHCQTAEWGGGQQGQRDKERKSWKRKGDRGQKDNIQEKCTKKRAEKGRIVQRSTQSQVEKGHGDNKRFYGNWAHYSASLIASNHGANGSQSCAGRVKGCRVPQTATRADCITELQAVYQCLPGFSPAGGRTWPTGCPADVLVSSVVLDQVLQTVKD